MSYIAVMPQEGSLSMTQFIAAFRVAFAVIIRMGSINEKKVGSLSFLESPGGRVAKVLSHSRFVRGAAISTANLPIGDQMKIILSFPGHAVLLGRKVQRQVHRMNHRVRQINRHQLGRVPHEGSDLQDNS